MKIIKLFLLLCLGIWAETSPKTPRCIEYETINKVLTKGWEYYDNNLTKWVHNDGEQFIIDFQKTVVVPLRQLTDQEYLQKQLQEYSSHKEIVESWGYQARSKEEYKRRKEQEIRHGIYFGNFVNRVDTDLYRYSLIMIKYLENQKKYELSYKLYIDLLNRLIDDIKIHGYSFMEMTIWEHKEKELFISLKSSLSSESYTQKQKSEISKLLFQLLPINKNAYVEIMKWERNLVFNYLHMDWIENKSLDDYENYDVRTLKRAIKLIDRRILKQFFEDKLVMNKLLNTYTGKYDAIHHQLLNMKSKKELDEYIEKMESMQDDIPISDKIRIFLVLSLDKVGLDSFSKMLQYKFSEDEFINVISQFSIATGKLWVFGKYKFEWEEIVRQNHKLLNSL